MREQAGHPGSPAARVRGGSLTVQQTQGDARLESLQGSCVIKVTGQAWDSAEISARPACHRITGAGVIGSRQCYVTPDRQGCP